VIGVGTIGAGKKDVGIYDNVSVTYGLGNDAISKNYFLSDLTTKQTLTLKQEVTRRQLTITGASLAPKTYDGTPTAGVLTPGNFAVGGVVGGDDVNIDKRLVGQLDNANATTGLGSNVKVTYTLGGGSFRNYVLANDSIVTLKQVVNKKELTIVGSNLGSMVYDGTKISKGLLTPGTVDTDVTVGVVKEDLTLKVESRTDMSGKDVNAQPYDVTVTYSLGSGTNGLASNYVLKNSGQVALKQTVTAKELTVTNTILAVKTYDGLKKPGALTLGAVSGTVAGETLLVTGAASDLASANAGTFANVGVSYQLADGTGLAANYVLSPSTQSQKLTQVVNKAPLRVINTGLPDTKIYDGTTGVANLSLGTLQGLVPGESFTLTSTPPQLSSKDVSPTPYVVTVNYGLLPVGGTNPDNYSFTASQDFGVTVTAKQLSLLNPNLSPKEYDGRTNTVGLLNYAFDGLVTDDDVTVTAAGSLADKNVGTTTASAMTYVVAGADAGNYSFTGPPELRQEVIRKVLTIPGTTLASKPYDGLKTPGALTLGTLIGLIDRETVTVGASVGELSDSAIGIRSAQVAYTLGDGANGGLKDNYFLSGGTLYATVMPNFDYSYALQANLIFRDSEDDFTVKKPKLSATALDLSGSGESRDIENFRMWRKGE
jgi:hypothetical protein